MRGPKPVDEYLKDLHRGAFSSSSSQQDRNSRIEIISNASESELGELPDDAASAFEDTSTPPLVASSASARKAGSPPSRAPRRRT